MDSAPIPHVLPFAHALSTALSSVPPVDWTGISELSISDMRAWSAAKADEYHTYSIAFNTIQNILAPVHRLPSEILSRIFVESWQDRRSLRLTHVCRLWRFLLLDTSEFWAVTISGDQFRLATSGEESLDEDYLDAACLRSSPRNIALRLSSLSPRVHLQLSQNTHRITCMQISAQRRSHLELLWKLLCTGMPHLEDLAIRVSDSIAKWVGQRQFSTEELPRLTRLTIHARLFRPTWPNTLQALALRSYHRNADFRSPFVVALDAVLRFLEDYPSLKVLDIRDNSLQYIPGSRPPSRLFPTLELLRIRAIQPTLSPLLSSLAVPPSTHLDISTVFVTWSAQGDLFPPSGAHDPVVAQIQRVTISSGVASTVRGFTAGGSECLRLRVAARLDNLTQTLHLFQHTGAPVSHLLLAQHPAQRMPVPSGGRPVFAAFPHLTHLTLHCRIGVCAEFICALYPPQPAPPADSESLLLLPLLTDLTVGVATKRRSAISASLRRGDLRRGPNSTVPVHFRECCRLLPVHRVPDVRSERGCRLSRLELFSYEEGSMSKPDSAVSHVDLAEFMPGLVESEIEPLRRLVDGPVVFSGYRFFTIL